MGTALSRNSTRSTDALPLRGGFRVALALCAALFACLACADTGGGREVRGVVRIMETGAPAPHATVVIDAFGWALPLALPPRSEVARATAGADGSFTITLPGNKKLKSMMIGVKEERCVWNSSFNRLDMMDLNEPLVLTTTKWDCAGK